MSRTTRGWVGLLIVALLVVAGCSRSPEAQKARHLERGDKFAAREQYHEAILEYRNVLRLDPANARAIRQLGLSHYRWARWASAFRYLLKAQQLTPDDHEVRLKLGGIYLFGGKREEAREEAGAVLSKEPNNLEALALLAGAATTPQGVDATIGLLEAQRATLGDRAKFYLTLGVLYLRKQDLPAAERAFQEAVAREPKSVEAHLPLDPSTSPSVMSLKPSASSRWRRISRPIGSAARLQAGRFLSLGAETGRGQAHPVGDHPEGPGLSARLASPGPDRV